MEVEEPEHIEVGNLFIESRTRSVTVGGDSVELATAEFKLLWILARKAGEQVTRDKMFSYVFNCEWDGLNRSVDVLVFKVRKKLSDQKGRLIKSVRSIGYMLAKIP